MKTTASWMVLIAACVAINAQTTGSKAENSESDLKSLELIDTVVMKAPPHASMLVPVRCDDDGNIYVRFYNGKSPIEEPVHKFNNRGESRASYSLVGDPMFDGRGKGALDFAIGKDGEVYQLAVAERGAYIIRHDKTGHIKSKIRLEADFYPSHFAVFDSGQFLATGTGLETKDNPDPHTIFTAIFDADGKLIKKINPPQDKEYEAAAERRDSEFVEPGQIGGGNYAVDLGMVARGSDGNLYVLRRTSPARVYGISPGGEIVHSFELPLDENRRIPTAVSAFKGKLAVAYDGNGEPKGSAIKLVNLEGEEYSTYDTSSLGATLACYSDPGRLTLITAQNGQMQFSFADVR